MKIESTEGKGSFNLIEGNKIISEVKYENWYANKASALCNNDFLEIEPSNFLRTKILIYRNKTEVGEMKFNWRGRVEIELRDSEMCQRKWSVKYKGVLKGKFEVYDDANEVVMRLIPSFHWKTLGYNYEIETIKELKNLEELCILSGFASAYLSAMLSAV
ncbi:hypothetical protein [Arcticibacterium luteifluviistationis]|uniref:Uncharacterized protein n=1 Tax=Arcticibacterium luteifluviistationis TaxID=1784714 RepID=A0A2Z4G895_9BACT|nr:hypothetical protein [Arcticibacterium luteifluviistationis]AWV97409.1 hypothetical protein DJ013_04160 [Arcticibacterium luteifluviistationis]